MGVLLEIFLPLSLAIIMFSLGNGLIIADFARVFTRAKAFLTGVICQIILIPVIAYLCVMAFGITGEVAVGIMLLSFCPGGVTSNFFSKIAKGDVALSVSLTALVTLMSIVTVPLFVAWAVAHFMGADAPEVNAVDIALAMFAITTVPVILGMALRALAPRASVKIERGLNILAAVLFCVIVIGAVAANWSLFVENLSALAPALIVMNALLMGLGLLIAGWAGLTLQERKTVSIEVGIQNSTLGITLAPIIVGGAVAIPVMALPAAVYGITMYLVAGAFLLIMRGR